MLVDAMCPQTPGKERFDPLVRLAKPADECAVEFSQCLEAHLRVTIHSLV